MTENLEQPNGCKWKMNYKCIMTTLLIIVLAISTSYLFIQYDKQNEMINNQMRYIEDLKSNITECNTSSSSRGILDSFFENNIFSFKNLWFDSNDIFVSKRNKQHSGRLSDSYYNHISQNITETEYIITTVLAGFTKEEVSIDLADNILTIKANHNDAKSENDKINKFSSGSHFSIKVPTDVDRETIISDLSNGILTIKLPRTQIEKTTKKIIVN
jgi:HSP20 family molecular chaperone IbpA